jgi:hypothetical protein
MRVDLAHEAVSVSAERWQSWHKIARAIGSDACALAKELCIADAAPTRRNWYWAVTAARILVQSTTGDQQRLANAIAVALESAGASPYEPAIGRSPQRLGRRISEKRSKEESS